MGGGLEADLSPGAVPVLCNAPLSGWRPVLQVADVTTHVPDATAPARYRLLLSDGVHSQHATLDPTLDRLARGGALRRGSVVKLLRFVPVRHARTILIFDLKILQTECALIGSLKFFEPKKNSGASSTSRSTSYGLSSDCKPCFGVIQAGSSRGSYPSGGDKPSSVALSEKPPVWRLVGQIKDENLGYSDKPDLITVKATISCVTEPLHNVACPLLVNGKRCNAKATGDVARTWHCDRCGYNFLEPKYMCSVHIQIQDHTGTASATAYEEAAEEILGFRAKDLYSMKYREHADGQLDDIIRRAVGEQYVFQLKVERQLLSGVKCTVLKAEKVNPSAESRRLLRRIDTLMQEGSGPGSELRRPTMPTCTGSYGAAILRLQLFGSQASDLILDASGRSRAREPLGDC